MNQLHCNPQPFGALGALSKYTKTAQGIDQEKTLRPKRLQKNLQKSAPRKAPKCAKSAKKQNGLSSETDPANPALAGFITLRSGVQISPPLQRRNKGENKKVRQVKSKSAPSEKHLDYTTMADQIARVKIILAKRSYVEYYRANKRMRSYVGNRLKNEKEKMAALEKEKDRILKQFIAPCPEGPSLVNINSAHSISTWLENIQSIKKTHQRELGFMSTKQHYKHFSLYLKDRGLDQARPSDISRNDMSAFQGWLLEKGNKNRSVNNTMGYIRCFFNVLLNQYQDVIDKNPCLGIPKLRTESESHVAYSDAQVKALKKWMEENDPELLFFSKFIVYCFLRIVEVTRMRCGWFDLDEGTLTVPAGSLKQGRAVVKYIPEVFLSELKKKKAQGKFCGAKDDFVFSQPGSSGKIPWRRERVTDRFSPARKALKLSSLHTLYGLRHTYISMLLEAGMNPQEVMPYTGHESLEAFSVYARSLRFKRPKKDISKKFRIKF